MGRWIQAFPHSEDTVVPGGCTLLDTVVPSCAVLGCTIRALQRCSQRKRWCVSWTPVLSTMCSLANRDNQTTEGDNVKQVRREGLVEGE